MLVHMKKEQKGFTLIELIVTIAIAGILIGVGIPSLRDMIINNRVTAYTNDFVSALYLARSEAIKRGKRVALCKSTDYASCAGGGGWEQGWVVFEDENNDGVFAPAEVIQIHEPLASGVTLTGIGTTAIYISFLSDGSTQTLGGLPVAGQLTVTKSGKTRTINLSRIGRIQVTKP